MIESALASNTICHGGDQQSTKLDADRVALEVLAVLITVHLLRKLICKRQQLLLIYLIDVACSVVVVPHEMQSSLSASQMSVNVSNNAAMPESPVSAPATSTVIVAGFLSST